MKAYFLLFTFLQFMSFYKLPTEAAWWQTLYQPFSKHHQDFSLWPLLILCCVSTCIAHTREIRALGRRAVYSSHVAVVVGPWEIIYKCTGIWQRLRVFARKEVVLCSGNHLYPQEASSVGPCRLLPPPLLLLPVFPHGFSPPCTPDRQTDVICCASPALGLYHPPQTAYCSHTGCKFRLPLSL